MKNSEICRAAMPFIRSPQLNIGTFNGMCGAISLGVKAGNPETILKILFCNGMEFQNTGFYFYNNSCEQGYTSRIIFLELAALMWEEEGN